MPPYLIYQNWYFYKVTKTAIIWNFTDGLFWLRRSINSKKKSKPRSVIVFLTEQIKSIDLKKLILEAYLKEKKTFFFQFYTESESMLKQSR